METSVSFIQLAMSALCELAALKDIPTLRIKWFMNIIGDCSEIWIWHIINLLIISYNLCSKLTLIPYKQCCFQFSNDPISSTWLAIERLNFGKQPHIISSLLVTSILYT